MLTATLAVVVGVLLWIGSLLNGILRNTAIISTQVAAELPMRQLAMGFWLVLALLLPSTLAAQEPSLLRDLPPMQVIIDHINVPTFILSQEAADVLRGRVIQELRAANVPISDAVEPTTWGSFLYSTTFPVERPTLFVSLNMVPDGCAFIANILVRMPVLLSGQTQETTVAAYASRSYAYLTMWTDHSPVLNYLEDFVVLWRAANEV